MYNHRKTANSIFVKESKIFGKEFSKLKTTERSAFFLLEKWYVYMNKFENLDILLNECETAKIYFTSLPDYVQGAVLKNSSNIQTENELHRIAENAMHDFT